MSGTRIVVVTVTGILVLCFGLMFLGDRCDQREIACTSQAYARCIDAHQGECIAAAQRVCGRGLSR